MRKPRLKGDRNNPLSRADIEPEYRLASAEQRWAVAVQNDDKSFSFLGKFGNPDRRTEDPGIITFTTKKAARVYCNQHIGSVCKVLVTVVALKQDAYEKNDD